MGSCDVLKDYMHDNKSKAVAGLRKLIFRINHVGLGFFGDFMRQLECLMVSDIFNSADFRFTVLFS